MGVHPHMMRELTVCLVALLASGLTLFSGFGLGTLLMPAFALFVPVPLAVAMTAVVHLLNNLFKTALVARRARWPIVWRFGVPAMSGAVVGAWMLAALAGAPPLARYWLFGAERAVRPVNLGIAAVMVAFVALEAWPRFQRITVGPRWLPVGGALSGFFGGLSGHQGALRSMFLIKTGLTTEEFIGTGVVIACLIDAARMLVYSERLSTLRESADWRLVAMATASAFLGAWVGARLMRKVTMRAVQQIVAVLLIVIAVGLGSGLLSS
jgi:uncharacterized membrane protein YfcA